MSNDDGLELPDPVATGSGLVQGDRSFNLRGLKKLLTINPDARDTEPVKALIQKYNFTDEELSDDRGRSVDNVRQ